jgi:hypothetical protein
VDRRAGIEYLCHSVTWATGAPRLLLVDTTTGQFDRLEIVGKKIGLKVTNPAPHCTGRYRFVGTYDVEPVPCPRQAQTVTGSQCTTCLAHDEFRFAHQVHRGGHVPQALDTYMSQPHWLYIATFARSATKIGTAAASRKTSRLHEQGPLFATYLARSPDGRTVRHLEDALGIELDIPQTVHSSVKLAGLVQPGRAATREEHDHIVAKAMAALSTWETSTDVQPWVPPRRSRCCPSTKSMIE